jgi:DNA helicase-2/ATP-dependent DNA helicase PcrA
VSTHDENEQSRFVAQRIADVRDEGVPLSEIAVLFRSSSHSFDLEIELGKQGIPFRKFGGIRFAESAHIKDALSFLRVVVKPSDTLSWFRALKLIDHIGDATVYQILEHLGVEQREFRSVRTKSRCSRNSSASLRERLTKLNYNGWRACSAQSLKEKLQMSSCRRCCASTSRC